MIRTFITRPVFTGMLTLAVLKRKKAPSLGPSPSQRETNTRKK